MPTILCIETTTTNCSVALVENGTIIGQKEDKSAQYSHAEKLHVFIDELLAETQTTYQDLTAVAVSKGPGSYTGLRIGVSAAKGLCFSLDIPLISISTLTILAQQIWNTTTEAKFVIPLLDARRMEVYTSVFNSEKKELTPVEAKVLSENSFEKYLVQGKVVFVGNGVAKFNELCQHPNAVFLETLPSAIEMVLLATAKNKISDFEDVAYFEPYYLKDFIVTKKKSS